MSQEIFVDARAPGTGKTRDAIERMAASVERRFIYCAPTHDLLAEVESKLEQAILSSTNGGQGNILRMDADHLPDGYKTLRAALASLDFTGVRILLLTHEGYKALPRSLDLSPWHVIIDEAPSGLIRFEQVTDSTLSTLLTQGLIEARDLNGQYPEPFSEGDDSIPAPEVAYFRRRLIVTDDGLNVIDSGEGRDKVVAERRKLLQAMHGSIAIRTSVTEVSILVDPRNLLNPASVTVLSATPTQGFLLEYCMLHGVQIQEQRSELSCPNLRTYYLEDLGEKLPSLRMLDRDADKIHNRLKRIFSAGGTLEGVRSQKNYIWSVNPRLEKRLRLDERRNVGVNATGINEFIEADVVIYIAATRLSPSELINLRALGIRPDPAVDADRHLGGLFQTVLRCRLRRDPHATVRALVTTRAEAKWLAEVTGSINPPELAVEGNKRPRRAS